MYEDIKKNKMKTGFVVFGFLLVITLIILIILGVLAYFGVTKFLIK